MNYVEKQYAEIFEEMLNDSLEKGLISHADEFQSYIKNKKDISNYYVMDKSVIAEIVAKIYKAMTSIYESEKVEYAEGSDLDDLGKLVGITRPSATCAEAECTFALSRATDEIIDIPAGVRVSTKDGIEFETIGNIFIPVGGTMAEAVPVRAVEAGVGGRIIEGRITKVVSGLDYSFSVTNEKPSSGGRDAYTDDEYRYLLLNWTKIRLKGSLEAFEYYFANFDGIDSYKIIPNWDGTGTIKCILDPGNSEQLNKAYNDLQREVVQASEDITMFPPTKKYIDIHAIVNVDIDVLNPYSDVEKDNIKEKIVASIKTFIDGGYTKEGLWYPGLFLGEDFIPHKLSVFLDNEISEMKNIEFTYPSSYIEILDEEIGVSNEINIEMV